MKVVSYLSSVPANGLGVNSQKELLLRYFVAGVQHPDRGFVHAGKDIEQNADVGVIQGWVHENTKAPHLQVRKNVIRTYKKQQKHVIACDANLFLFHNKQNPWGYLRYSFDGVFPNTGIYCDTEIDPKRWLRISNTIKLKLHERKKAGSHILLCLQRNGGWSMDGLGVTEWIASTVKKIRKYSDRPILLRAHPGDKRAPEYLLDRFSRIRKLDNVKVSTFGRRLEDDLIKAHAVVNHNSSSIVGPLIYGFPAFITDPGRSQCAEVCHHNFKNIEEPLEFDREAWLQRISMFHWNFDELKSGEAWSHMRGFIE
jgi:hypothetical protein|tara:strand:- start:6318 stop:7253 length:936 start_codon:yes stop_codon:yes gene_type:complete